MEPEKVIETIKVAYYSLKKKELNNELSEKEAIVIGFNDPSKVYDKCLKVLRLEIANKYLKNPSRQQFKDGKEIYFNPSTFTNEYPVIFSTTFSSRATIGQGTDFLFDYVIMDEASQVDIAAGALALNCARSAVIVGDPKQLPNVVAEKDAKYAEAIFKESALPEAYKFVNNSFLDSILKLFPSCPVTLLKEHYRCHPQIIGLCNKQFYNNQLVTMTRRETEDRPLSIIIRSAKGNHARGTSNRRQAEEIIDIVRTLISDYEDIGIITPFKAQAALISSLLKENGLPELPVSTVHKFQGRENNVIILSTVSNEILEFIDDPHLLNVAVSRAKKKFILAITGNEIKDSNIRDLVDYIAYYNGEIKDSKVCSIFDILYKQYAEERQKFIKSRIAVSQYESENIMFALLGEITSLPEWGHLGIMPQYPLRRLIKSEADLTEREREYANNSWTLVDFILYNQTTKRPVLAIEVDGMAFHKSGSVQSSRDAIKNSVLQKAHIPLLRLSTDGSNERQRIIDALSQCKDSLHYTI